MRKQVSVVRARHAPRGGCTADIAWSRTLHDLLEVPWPCSEEAEFSERWPEILDPLRHLEGPAHVTYDADRTLAHASWCVLRHLRPVNVIETGVARGVTSRVLLEALERNSGGHLWSIDLPPIEQRWAWQVGVAVPDRLRHRWTYLRGSSRRLLPELCDKLKQVDVFVHDSLHTEPNVRFELLTAWAALRPGGVVIADDVDHSRGFESLLPRLPDATSVVASQAEKGGTIGIIVKRRVSELASRPSGAP